MLSNPHYFLSLQNQLSLSKSLTRNLSLILYLRGKNTEKTANFIRYLRQSMNLKDRTALLISDNMTQTTMIRKILDNKGMTVVDWSDPSKFTQIYDQSFFQVIVLCLFSHKKGELSYLDVIKYNNANKMVPILLLGEKTDRIKIEKGIKAGANSTLVLPLNAAHLVQKVYGLIKDYKGIEIELSEDQEIKFNAGALGKIIDFNELHLRIVSSVKLKERHKVDIESKFFHEIESSHVNLESIYKSQVKSVGTYVNTFKILGLNNEGLMLLRKHKVRKE